MEEQQYLDESSSSSAQSNKGKKKFKSNRGERVDKISQFFCEFDEGWKCKTCEWRVKGTRNKFRFIAHILGRNFEGQRSAKCTNALPDAIQLAEEEIKIMEEDKLLSSSHNSSDKSESNKKTKLSYENEHGAESILIINNDEIKDNGHDRLASSFSLDNDSHNSQLNNQQNVITTDSFQTSSTDMTSSSSSAMNGQSQSSIPSTLVPSYQDQQSQQQPQQQQQQVATTSTVSLSAFNNSSEFEILVSKSDFKFNCAHFIAYKGFRERLHGHNYHLSIKVTGNGTLNHDGYVIDFGDIKKATRSICQSFNEYFICPMNSDAMVIFKDNVTNNLCLTCEDGSYFSFPKSDCVMLPIYHSSAEELAHYIYCQLVSKIGMDKFSSRGIHTMEVTVAEAPLQQATFRSKIPRSVCEYEELLKPKLLMKPSPCFALDG